MVRTKTLLVKLSVFALVLTSGAGSVALASSLEPVPCANALLSLDTAILHQSDTSERRLLSTAEAADFLARMPEGFASLPAQHSRILFASLVQRFPGLGQTNLSRHGRTPVQLAQVVATVLRREELVLLHQQVYVLLEAVQAVLGSQASTVDQRSVVLGLLREMLSVSIANPREVSLRMRRLESGRSTEQVALDVFGFQNITQAESNYFNSANPEDPNTIVGRLVQEIRQSRPNSVKVMQHKFGNGNGTKEGSHDKTVVLLNAQLANTFYEKVMRLGNYTSHNYRHNQGTLQWMHNGENNNYASRSTRTYSRSFPWNEPNATESTRAPEFAVSGDTVFPVVLVSTTEASLFENYYLLGGMTNSARAKYPSSLQNQAGKSYSETGAYSCCTHWIGEAPLGLHRKVDGIWQDARTSVYRFPGAVDSYGSVPDRLTGKTSPEPRTSPLVAFDRYVVPNRAPVMVGHTSRLDRLTRLVWHYPSAPLQLWETLGLRDQLDRAELTNPGWVRFAMVSAATNDRVPVVFVFFYGEIGSISDDEAKLYLDNLDRGVSKY